MNTTSISYKTTTVDGFKIFYREAGNPQSPAVLLLHGFPTSSHMFRNLIPQLSEEYHLVAPDLPGFGFSDAPDHKSFVLRFEHLAEMIGAIHRADWPAEVCGIRLRLRRSDRVPSRARPSGADYGSHLPKRKCLRRGVKQGLGAGPCLLGKSHPGEP